MRKMRRHRWAQLAVLVTLLLSKCAGQNDWSCENEPSCKCIWASGKRTAECKQQNLTEIPRNLSKETQQLDLTGNSINHLPERVFTGLGLDNLQKLILRGCGIKNVHPEAFSGLLIVIEIDLSENRIKSLYPGTFDQTVRLRVLLLNKNHLQRLDDGLFRDLPNLQKVELSGNRLSHVGQATFSKLPTLLRLTLDENELAKLDIPSFDGLSRLSSLELHKNPWNCDCHLKPFRDWSIKHRLYTRPTACAQPGALAGRTWDDIKPEEFACPPQIQSIGAEQRGAAGSGAGQLWCRAVASPRAQISWFHRSRVLANGTKRYLAPDKSYVLYQDDEWSNLTIPEIASSDKGEYVCIAKNFGGQAERNVSLSVQGADPRRQSGMVGLLLAIGLGLVAFIFLVMAVTLCLCYCRRRRNHHDEKSAEAASLDHHGLGEQEKSLITAINPVVKPPRRYEAPSLTSHGTEMTELNRTLLDNDSVFADGVGSVVGVLANGLHEEERGRATPDLDSVLGVHNSGGVHIGREGSITGLGNTTTGSIHGMMTLGRPGGGSGSGSIIGSGGGNSSPGVPMGGGGGGGGLSPLAHGGSVISGLGTLTRNSTPYRQYPPDLLAFSGGRNSSPTSQASTAPDSSRLPSQQPQQQLTAVGIQQQQQQHHHQQQLYGGPPPSPSPSVLAVATYAPIGFKTLPHPVRAASATPYSMGHHHPTLSRLGYGTIPRRPRAPSWSSGPPTSPTDRELSEPVYDNLGVRTTADGSSKRSLNKSPEPVYSMRGRPLPSTPTTPSSMHQFTLPRAPRSSSALRQLNRSAPEGASEWPVALPNEKRLQPRYQQHLLQQELRQQQQQQHQHQLFQEQREQQQQQQHQHQQHEQLQQQQQLYQEQRQQQLQQEQLQQQLQQELRQQQQQQQRQEQFSQEEEEEVDEEQQQQPQQQSQLQAQQQSLPEEAEEERQQPQAEPSEKVKDEKHVQEKPKQPAQTEEPNPESKVSEEDEQPTAKTRKVPPRPPPKPKNKSANGPLYEDEGEDGTEV